MDSKLFLQHLRDLPLEEGKAYIQEHIEELVDYAAIGVLLKDESLPHRNIHPFVSLKLAELLIFLSECVHHIPSQVVLQKISEKHDGRATPLLAALRLPLRTGW